MSKMDDGTLLSIIRSHRDDALGVEDSQLTSERAAAMNHYQGRPYGNEVEGRSQVVSRDLMEAVDWAMPGIMRVFVQSGNLGEFDPVGPDDEPLALQESDYINQVLMRDNPGFIILHDAIKDTLLLKNGYVKHFWEETEKIEEAEYSGLSMDQITLMLQQLEAEGAETEVIGAESHMVDLGGLPGMPMPPQNPAMGIMNPMQAEVWDIRLKVKRKDGKLVWMAVPAEEVRVSRKCRGSLQESPFTEHVTTKPRSDLIEMGMDRAFVDSLPSNNETTTDQQSLARDSVDDESESTGSAAGDRSMDEIQYCEAYIRVDYDGDGVAELRKVVTAGDKLPPGAEWNEPIPAVPMSAFVAKRVPHRHTGESLDDELADLQEIMTVLKRQMLDNIYANNNSEIVINEDANLKDFMTRMPGGIKRTKGSNPVQNSVMPLVTKPIIGDILPVIDFFESSKETRSGISRASTEMNPDALKQVTKGAYMEQANRASQKMEMIARMLAETGVKETLIQSHAILTRHQNQKRLVQMRGRWVPVNPREWKNRTDLTVRVGLGTGNEEEKRQKLLAIAERQEAVSAFGLVGPRQAYAMFEDQAKALGADMPEKYVMSPDGQEFKQFQAQQQQNSQQANQLAEAEQVKAQAAMQIAAQKDAFERQRVTMQAQIDQREAESDRRMQVMVEQMRLASKESVAAMAEEVKLLIAGMKIDLGQPGFSAGVQNAPGVDPAMQQMPQAPQPDQPFA